MNRYNRYGLDFHTDYKKVVESMNAQKISQFLQNVLLKSGHHVEVTMMPE
jgi:zinc protease